jgi:hypothetical protein
VGRFQFGQIIEAYLSDGHGHQIENPCPPYHVVIAARSLASPGTGLSATCVAKCNWVREVAQTKVIRSLGYLDDDLMTEIVARFDELYRDDKFDGWT